MLRTFAILVALCEAVACASSASSPTQDDSPYEQEEVPESVRMMEEAAAPKDVPKPDGAMVLKAPRVMEIGTKDSKGTLPRDEIHKVINKNIGQIQRCYETQLRETPTLSGRVSMKWVIGLQGKVGDVGWAEADLPAATVECISDRIKSWVFPRPKGGTVVVTYPFIFKSIAN